MDSNMDSMIIENEMIVPVSIEFGEDFSREELDQLCRLCGNSSHQLMPIFSGDGNEHKLPDKIREHLPIIEVSKSDTLPLSMCYQCASTLISWHELYYACKEADQRLKELCARLNLRKSKSDEDLMDIHESSLENDDDIDSFETTELPREQGTPSKSEIIVPGELKEETTFDDTYNVSESFVEKTEESVTIETNNSTITESQSVAVTSSNVSETIADSSSTTPPHSSADLSSQNIVIFNAKVEYRPLSPVNISAISCPLELPSPRTSSCGRHQCYKCDRRFLNDVFLNMHYNEGRVVFANPAIFHQLYEQMRTHPLLPPDKIDPFHPFICGQCDQRYESKNTLRTHIYCYHPSVEKFKCDFCSATFVTECDLAEHRVTHSAERQLICLRCGRRRATGSLPYETNRSRIAFEMCGCKGALCRTLLPAAASSSSAPLSTVVIIDKTDSTRHGLQTLQSRRRRQSRSSVMKVTEKMAAKRKREKTLETLGTVCGECGKEFPTRISLRRHLRVHKNPTECAVCGKKYGRAYMKNHMLIHSLEKTYVCHKCGRRFAQLSSLRSHQLLEEDVRKFICNHCGMSFVLSSRLHSHMKTHMEDQPFKCEDCGRGYGYIWQLRQHRIRHSDVRPFACEKCGRAYKTMKHLRQHYAVHRRD